MSDSYRVLERLQIGLEATAGTAVAAQVLTGGTLSLNGDYAEVEMLRAGFGERLPVVSASFVKRYKADGLRADLAPSPQILTYFLRAGVSGSPDVTEITTGGSDYRHVFNPSMAVSTLTLEAGTGNGHVYQLPYGLVTGITISGNAADGTASMSVDLQAQKREPVNDFSAVTLRPSVFLHGALVKLMKGGTELANCVVDWEYSYKTGLNGKRTGGSLFYTAHGFGEAEATLSLGLERTAEVIALEQDYKNREVINITFEVDSGIKIGGTETTQKFIVSAPAVITEYQPFGKDNQENAIESVVFSLGVIAGGAGLTMEVVTDHD